MGKKYVKVVTNESVCAFVVACTNDKKFQYGDILKPACWKTPARNFARGNIFDSVDKRFAEFVDKLDCYNGILSMSNTALFVMSHLVKVGLTSNIWNLGIDHAYACSSKCEIESQSLDFPNAWDSKKHNKIHEEQHTE